MPIANTAAFLDGFAGTLASSWDALAVSRLASREIPQDLLGSRWGLLTGDLRFLWAAWWVQTFGDPAQLAGADYPELYARTRAQVAERYPGEPAADINRTARSVARLLQDLVRQRQRTRVPLSGLDRRQLVVDAGAPPRCWICGWEFPGHEVDRFLGLTEEIEPVGLPLYVDVAKPRGRSVSDLRINADHVVPVAAGGGHMENLRLACGWCNRWKSASLSVYDAPLTAGAYQHPRLGTVTLPHPLWVIRVLATVARCEAPTGCQRTTATDELTVAPRWGSGALTPPNLTVTCHEHDPWTAIRWVPR